MSKQRLLSLKSKFTSITSITSIMSILRRKRVKKCILHLRALLLTKLSEIPDSSLLLKLRSTFRLLKRSTLKELKRRKTLLILPHLQLRMVNKFNTKSNQKRSTVRQN